MDLGECLRIHDLALKADFEMASKTRDYYYDIDVSITSITSNYHCITGSLYKIPICNI